jgi:serine/threonine-protein kinase CHEK1
LNFYYDSAPYVAPEVLSKSEYRAQPTDIWSAGIVLVAMLAGELPWDKPVLECADFVSWLKNNYQKTPWCKIQNTALSLLRNILIYDPTQRFTIKQIKSSAWFMRTHRHEIMSAIDLNSMNNTSFLSQPTVVYYINEPNESKTAGLYGNIAVSGVQDSQENCECASQMHEKTTGLSSLSSGGFNAHDHFESFSQPIYTENMFLNSQIQPTTQNLSSQYGASSNGAASQSPLLKLVKRMTRMFVHSSVERCCDELKTLFQKFMYDYKVAILSQRQHQITVNTSDKRQTLLTFKVNIIEMNLQNEVLVDFRLSRGDGLEFKKIFMKVKASLSHIVCKKYVFTNSHHCCDKRVQQLQTSPQQAI